MCVRFHYNDDDDDHHHQIRSDHKVTCVELLYKSVV